MRKLSRITAICICMILLFTSCSIPAKRPDDEIGIVAEVLTPEYVSVIYDYDALLNFRLSDTFEEDYNDGKTADLTGDWVSAIEGDTDLAYKWYCMVVDMLDCLENPTKADFGYILKDINDDNFPELFWVSNDYDIHAIFTVVDGEEKLLDAFWPRYKGLITDENKIYTRGSSGATCIDYEIKELNANGEWATVENFGIDDADYYELVEGEKTSIDEQQFNELLSANPFEMTKNWKEQAIIPIE